VSDKKDREQILKEIIDIELRMFLTVQTSDPSACQEEPETFRLMRRAGYHVLSTETLESYLKDLQEALEEDRNLITLKYARIDKLIPTLNDNPVIGKIVEAEEHWLKALEKKYPSTFRNRADFAALVYLRSELETYSDRTLELYFKDVSKALEEERNLTAERYTFLFQQIGFKSIDDMEREQARAK
jgi:gluconate kinase